MPPRVHVALPDGYADRLIVLDQRLRHLWKRIGNPNAYSEEVSDLSDELQRLAGRR